jgi:hypothetical protein
MQKGGQRDLFGRADLAMTTNYQVLLFPNFIPLSGVKSALYGGYAYARRRIRRRGTRSAKCSAASERAPLCDGFVHSIMETIMFYAQSNAFYGEEHAMKLPSVPCKLFYWLWIRNAHCARLVLIQLMLLRLFIFPVARSALSDFTRRALCHYAPRWGDIESRLRCIALIEPRESFGIVHAPTK